MILPWNKFAYPWHMYWSYHHQLCLITIKKLSKVVFYSLNKGCGVGAGVIRNRRFLGGVGFLTTLGVRVRVGFFLSYSGYPIGSFFTSHFCIGNSCRNGSFFWNFCWNRDFFLCTTISIDINSRTSFPSCQRVFLEKSESEILEWWGQVGYFASKSATQVQLKSNCPFLFLKFINFSFTFSL